MKKATCKDLRGACDEVITGTTPEEMGENSRAHVMDMLSQDDEAHKQAVASMQSLSQEEQQAWYNNFKNSFNSLEDA